MHGTYEIVGRVGSGGMADVYEARHTRLPGRFAIKVLTGEAAPDAAQRDHFRREAEIAARLRHPNIVQVVDFNETPDGVPFLVMELLEGHDLAREIERTGAMDLARTVAIVDQITSALALAHGQGIVHRDLKPQNVFLVPVVGQSREIVKVLDFGISKSLGDPTRTGDSLVGTPRYMAPEQARGLAADVDGRSDQFALGAIAYELLTGRPAFAATDIPATLYKVVNEEPPTLASVVPGVDARAAAAIGRALSKDRTRRFLSVLDFAAEFAASSRAPFAQRGAQQSDPAATTVPRAGGVAHTHAHTIRRHPLRWVAAAAATIVGLAILANLQGDPSPAPTRAPGEAASAATSPKQGVTQPPPPAPNPTIVPATTLPATAGAPALLSPTKPPSSPPSAKKRPGRRRTHDRGRSPSAGEAGTIAPTAPTPATSTPPVRPSAFIKTF